MNRRTLLAALPLLAFAPPVQAQPAVAQIIYGPAPITSPQGETFWMAAVPGGAFAIPDYDTLRGIFTDDQDFAQAVRACGEWTLHDGWPNKWSHTEARWVALA